MAILIPTYVSENGSWGGKECLWADENKALRHISGILLRVRKRNNQTRYILLERNYVSIILLVDRWRSANEGLASSKLSDKLQSSLHKIWEWDESSK